MAICAASNEFLPHMSIARSPRFQSHYDFSRVRLKSPEPGGWVASPRACNPSPEHATGAGAAHARSPIEILAASRCYRFDRGHPAGGVMPWRLVARAHRLCGPFGGSLGRARQCAPRPRWPPSRVPKCVPEGSPASRCLCFQRPRRTTGRASRVPPSSGGAFPSHGGGRVFTCVLGKYLRFPGGILTCAFRANLVRPIAVYGGPRKNGEQRRGQSGRGRRAFRPFQSTGLRREQINALPAGAGERSP